MPLLTIGVRNKVAESPTAHIVCGNSDYTIEFNFDAEWDSHETKTARFIYDGKLADVIFTGNTCPVPIITNARVCLVGVFAGDLQTTTPALIDCEPSILCGSGVPADPTPDVYAQLLEMYDQMGVIPPETIEKAVEEYLKEHPIEGGEVEIPETLPNPHKLTFTGTVTAEYDGSKEVTVEIPEGGSGGGIEVTGAEVGQTIVVKAVDETGRPISWEPSDLVKKTKIITVADITADHDIVVGGDNDDNTFGDAAVMTRHFFYKTPEGNQLKAKRIWGYIQPAASFVTSSFNVNVYYEDGTPHGWSFGDNGIIYDFSVSGSTVAAGYYWVFASSADLKIREAFITAKLGWRSGSVRASHSYYSLDAIFPHISGIKITSNSSHTLPAGSRIVIRAEVEDDA